MNILEEFQKRAAVAGLTEQQITAFVEENFANDKTAEAAYLDEVYKDILTQAGVEKNAQTVAYLEGFLKQSLDRGFAAEEAVELAKVACNSALAQTCPLPEKQAVEKISAEQELYLQGMFEKAAAYGLSQAQTVEFLKVAGQSTDLLNLAALRTRPKARTPSRLNTRTSPRFNTRTSPRFNTWEAASDAGKTILPTVGAGLGGVALGAALPDNGPLLTPTTGAATGGAATGGAATGGAATGGAATGGAATGGAATGGAATGGSIDKLLAYLEARPELLTAAGGAGLGGLLGSPDNEEEPDNRLLGAALGGGAGYAAGKWGPELFKGAPKAT